MDEEDLLPSALGTKSYWEKSYKTELENFNEFGDVGEIWFGTACERRIVRYLCAHLKDVKTVNVVDLGCGNGSLLISLAKKGFEHLVGIDYSQDAIVLARKVAEGEKLDRIVFKETDILESNSELENKFNVILDKGTYDAISLMDSSTSARNIYKENVKKFFVSDDRPKTFVLASCNWTKEELLNFFRPEFVFCEELEAPALQFGGQTGRTVTTIVFQFSP